MEERSCSTYAIASPVSNTPPSFRTLDEDLTRTPQSICSLKRQADFLLEATMPPAVRLCLSKFVKGAMIQANTKVLLHKSLQTTKAAGSARETRTTKAWHGIQPGGIMYA